MANKKTKEISISVEESARIGNTDNNTNSTTGLSRNNANKKTV